MNADLDKILLTYLLLGPCRRSCTCAKRILEAAVQSFDRPLQLRMVSSCLPIRDVEHLASLSRRLEVNCGLRSEMIISGTPKHEIQVNVEAFAHAAADVSESGIASIHLDVRSMIVKI